ncbi:MAG: hypothetical protein ACI4OH_05170 [Mitsuokella sp.]|uniref:hypothetical protein n=1 Tax=Mitsuokella sp. TaxID=2049034 RepID=UPI003F0B8B71
MITINGEEYREESELNLEDYLNSAREKVGKTYPLEYLSRSKQGQKAGEFEILAFEEKNAHWFYNDVFDHWDGEKNYYIEVVHGAKLGFYTIKFHNTKFYKEKTMRFPVWGFVESRGKGDFLRIWANIDGTDKRLRAYDFPSLDLEKEE